MARTEQPVAEWISGLTAVASIGTGDKIAVLQSGTVKSATDSDLKNLIGQPTLIGDYDISTANTSITIASAFSSIGVGDKIRYAWSGGDGTYTFSWSDGASYTLNGITADNYIGEGVGHLDIVKTATATGNIINAGEIWDNDGGNFGAGDKWHKTLSGELKFGGWMYTAGNGSVNLNHVLNLSLTPAEILSLNFTVGKGVLISGGTPADLTVFTTSPGTVYGLVSSITGAAQITINYTGVAATNVLYYYAITYTLLCRWTTSYPRIT